MWGIIVAGHFYLVNGQPFYTNNHRTCLNTASIVGGQCVPVQPPTPQPDPAMQCLASGACKLGQ